jgi:lipoprotein-anchoring transpeptidase ErfK/SrfK
MILSRRSLFTAAMAAGLSTAAEAKLVPGEPFEVHDDDDQKVDYPFRKQVVDAPIQATPGTIVVNPAKHFLYLVITNGRAVRFGIGTGKYGDWSGETVVGRMEQWPIWTPTPDHLKRRPDLIQYIHGMPGGLRNPMGSRAIYLFKNNADTTYRIHGTDVAEHIGTKSTAGCFAMFNADVIWLYKRVKLGTRVVVLA